MILIPVIFVCDVSGCKNRLQIEVTLERRDSGKYRINPYTVKTPDGWTDDYGHFCPDHKEPYTR